MSKLSNIFRDNLITILWILSGVFTLALIVTSVLFAEQVWIPTLVGAGLLGSLGALAWRNKQALLTRRTAYGLYSTVTVVVVLGIVAVINYFGYQYPQKVDLTKNRLHTFSEQTTQLMKGLDTRVSATFFSTMGQREEFRPILEEYRDLSPKFKLEYVDPNRSPTRARQLEIKRMNTLYLEVGEKNSKIEDPSEEKITNELIKLTRKDSLTVCNIEGHGEKSFDATEAEGFSGVKKGIESLAYQGKVVNLAQEGKIPEDCGVIMIAGPTRAFFEKEVELISEYLNNGGRALIAVDINIQGSENAAELIPLLKKWYVGVENALIVDPLSRLFGADASIPIIPEFATSHPITKDFRKDIRNTNCFFPFSRPLKVLEGAPSSLKVAWLAKSSPQSWGEYDLKSLGRGKVRLDGKDSRGPLTVAITVSGKQKDSKAKRETRMVALATSLFAANGFLKHGLNTDLVLNSISWLLEDEKQITIRTKEDDPGRIEMTREAGVLIFWICVVIAPALIAIAGIVIWIRRRKL